MDFYVEPSEKLSGEIEIPGDKSISHRAVIFGSLASGVSQFTNFLTGEDCLATLNAFKEMGVFANLSDDQLIYTVSVLMVLIKHPKHCIWVIQEPQLDYWWVY